jgi:hypothetical protein
MALISSGCIKKNTGWWTYEVCHGDEVRQYHPEQNKVDSSQSWSLGRIDFATRPLVVHNEPKASTPATGGSSHVVVEFAGGQFCDEIKAPRSGELHYVCSDAVLFESSLQPAVIQSIDEPTKCRYIIVVAVPTLCAVLPKPVKTGEEQGLGGQQQSAAEEASAIPIADGPEASERRLEHTISSIAEQYNGACFYRVDGWWTYELCINRHVRQFRQPEKEEKELEDDKGDTVEQEFYLGLFQGSVPAGDLDVVGAKSNAAADVGERAKGGTRAARKGSYAAHLHRHDPVRSFASAEYSAGDPCEVGPEWESDIARLEQSRYRETEVRFQCAENGRDSLVSVREVTTCAYLLVFASARLCEVPEFSLAAVVSSSRGSQCTHQPTLWQIHRRLPFGLCVCSKHRQCAKTQPVLHAGRQPQQIVCYFDDQQQPEQRAEEAHAAGDPVPSTPDRKF